MDVALQEVEDVRERLEVVASENVSKFVLTDHAGSLVRGHSALTFHVFFHVFFMFFRPRRVVFFNRFEPFSGGEGDAAGPRAAL